MLNNRDRMSTVLWQREDIIAIDMTNKWQDWLTDRGSLTNKLSFALGCETKIHVLSEGWGRPDKTELARLGMKKEQGKVFYQKSAAQIE